MEDWRISSSLPDWNTKNIRQMYKIPLLECSLVDLITRFESLSFFVTSRVLITCSKLLTTLIIKGYYRLLERVCVAYML